MSSIHIFPIERMVDRYVAETRAIFLAREAVTLGAFSPAFHRMVDRLTRSENDAIATEARRLKECAR